MDLFSGRLLTRCGQLMNPSPECTGCDWPLPALSGPLGGYSYPEDLFSPGRVAPLPLGSYLFAGVPVQMDPAAQIHYGALLAFERGLDQRCAYPQLPWPGNWTLDDSAVLAGALDVAPFCPSNCTLPANPVWRFDPAVSPDSLCSMPSPVHYPVRATG